MHIQICGPVVIRAGGERIEGALPGRQGIALLGYLLLRRREPATREVLMEALWGTGRPASADAALSALVSKLRKAIAPASIEGRSELRLALPEGTFVDLEAAREAIHRAEGAVSQRRWTDAWAPARVALYTAQRPLLAMVEANWIEAERREMEEIRLRALESVAATGLALGGPELAAAERAGRDLVEAAPFRESGHRLLMEVLEARDNVAEALLVYERLRRRLDEELAITPGAVTQELHRRLLIARGE